LPGANPAKTSSLLNSLALGVLASLALTSAAQAVDLRVENRNSMSDKIEIYIYQHFSKPRTGDLNSKRIMTAAKDTTGTTTVTAPPRGTKFSIYVKKGGETTQEGCVGESPSERKRTILDFTYEAKEIHLQVKGDSHYLQCEVVKKS
jgi:hypothetical protein